ncbi:hypothetical protein Z042_14695 [Chania multitudinisentens RB-25]|uniref:RNA polymerase sigma 70 n=1 Tax=Chania multitudinisentens RB-25 TaxID=1441930 RepID=W0LEB3_9GAMM|nr:sigma-70 family RNA polymerase sigma factor [Chania multitudinisentens]AHG20719.1 hypothetical protein Z042_14695 [Chania multitudinisentens RB-25]
MKALHQFNRCMTTFWARHQTEFHRFLKAKTGDNDLAFDLLQELFLKARAASDTFCQMQNPRAWLYTCARHLLIDTHRKAKPYQALDDSLFSQEESPSAITSLTECLPVVLETLSQEEREVIELCDLRQYKQKEVAALKNLSLPAVKSRLLRARQHLKQQLIELCANEMDERSHVCCDKKIF